MMKWHLEDWVRVEVTGSDGVDGEVGSKSRVIGSEMRDL